MSFGFKMALLCVNSLSISAVLLVTIANFLSGQFLMGVIGVIIFIFVLSILVRLIKFQADEGVKE